MAADEYFNSQPNERWIIYLMAARGLGVSEVRKLVRSYGLPAPSPDYLMGVFEWLQEEAPDEVTPSNREGRAWLRKERILSLVREDPHAVGAREVLSNYPLRRVMEYLLLADCLTEDIVGYADEIIGASITAEEVDAFRHYFWDTESMSPTDWLAYFRAREDGPALGQCYNRAPDFALWKLGYRAELRREDALELMFTDSFMRFAETNTQSNDKHTASAAKFWSEIAFKAHDLLNQSSDELTTVVESLRQVSIKLGRRDISSIEEIRDGKQAD